MTKGPPPLPRRSSGGRAVTARLSREQEALLPDAKLLCTAGPKSGEEFVLQGQEIVIGRAID
jgi:hypothetical protein